MNLEDLLGVKGTDVYRINPEASLAEVVAKLVDYNCGSLVVCEGEKMVGIITERDILKACDSRNRALEEVTVQSQMTPDVITGTLEDEIEQIMGIMTKNRIRHLPVLTDGKISGLISIGDVVKAQHAQLSVENHYLKEYIQK